MILSENRCPLFRIMLRAQRAPKRKPGLKDRAHLTRCGAIYSENAKKQWFVWHLVSRFSGKRAASGRVLPGTQRAPGRRTADIPSSPVLRSKADRGAAPRTTPASDRASS